MGSVIRRIGIIGGGQLGMYLSQASERIGVKSFVYADGKGAPAEKFASKMFYGSYDDKKKLEEFSSKVDLLTYEFENISVKALNGIKKSKIYPPLSSLKISQDRELEKTFFSKNKIQHAGIAFLKKKNDINKCRKLNFPVILKTSRFGYDGKGQFSVESFDELKKKWGEIDFQSCVVEKIIELKEEVSVICAKDIENNVYSYEPFSNKHKNHILFETRSPAKINSVLALNIKNIALSIIKNLNYVGVLTVEFFIDKNDFIYVNEIAPRVHNSGHITLNNANISQFELHILSILGQVTTNPKIIKKGIMRNLIGKEIKKSREICSLGKYSSYKKSQIYNYGKKDVKEGRKMGHINFS